MWMLKDFAEGKEKNENIHIMKAHIESLPENIKDINFKVEVGINYCSLKTAYDLVLISEFKSKEDLERYRCHAEHQKVVEFISKVTDKVALVDFEV